MKLSLFVFACCLLFGTISYSQNNLRSPILHDFLQSKSLINASVGIHIVNTENGHTILEYNPDVRMIPASSLKLITSASALQILGDDYTFKTEIGFYGKISSGELKGDLVVIGGGDPTLGSEYFQDHYFNSHFLREWARQTKAAGIKKINGNLRIDVSIYDKERVPPTWIWEDIGNYYGAGANALTVYDNLFRITFKSPRTAGKPTEIINYYPKIEGLVFQNQVLSSDVNRDLAYVFGSPFDNIRQIRGTIPKKRKAFTIKAAIHQPEKIVAHEFKNYLAKEGIFFTGDVIFKTVDRNSFHCFYIQESPALKEIVKVINHESVNLFAEHLVKQLAYETEGKGNRERGIEIILDYWKKQDLQTNKFYMEDGSGLSHFNAVSPKTFTDILLKIKDDLSFTESLPNAGNGTVYHFSSKKFPEQTLLVKSGSMTRVRCYVGYLKTANGKRLAFAIMTNHFEGTHSALIKQIENLFEQLSNGK